MRIHVMKKVILDPADKQTERTHDHPPSLVYISIVIGHSHCSSLGPARCPGSFCLNLFKIRYSLLSTLREISFCTDNLKGSPYLHCVQYNHTESLMSWNPLCLSDDRPIRDPDAPRIFTPTQAGVPSCVCTKALREMQIWFSLCHMSSNWWTWPTASHLVNKHFFCSSFYCHFVHRLRNVRLLQK